jgi:hypothetical protein
MRKTGLLAVPAAVIATGLEVWAATNARVAPPNGSETFQLMMNAKGLATAEFADYTFVFH